MNIEFLFVWLNADGEPVEYMTALESGYHGLAAWDTPNSILEVYFYLIAIEALL